MDKQKVALLKKMLTGLTPKKNFDADFATPTYPHCVIGEKNLYIGGRRGFFIGDLLPAKDAKLCWAGSGGGLTHARALAMIRRAIKRWSKPNPRRNP